MLTSTTCNVIKYAHDRFNILLNRWQVDALETIMSTPTNTCIIRSPRRVGKTTLINILASFYAYCTQENSGIIYYSYNLQNVSKQNIAYLESNNIHRSNLSNCQTCAIGNRYNIILMDEIDRWDFVDIQSKLYIIMYTP